MMYQIGDKASWRSVNRDYTGVIVGFHGNFAIARINGSGKSVLLQNKPLTPKKNDSERNEIGVGTDKQPMPENERGRKKPF